MKYLLPFIFLFAANLYAAPVALTWTGSDECAHEMRLQLEDGTWEPVGVTVPGIKELLIETDGYKAAQVWGKNDFGYSKEGTNILTFDAPPTPGGLKVKKSRLSWLRKWRKRKHT